MIKRVSNKSTWVQFILLSQLGFFSQLLLSAYSRLLLCLVLKGLMFSRLRLLSL